MCVGAFNRSTAGLPCQPPFLTAANLHQLLSNFSSLKLFILSKVLILGIILIYWI